MLETVSCKIDNILVKELTARGFRVNANTVGTSMYPIVKTGYKILIDPKNLAELNIGDIVLCQRGDFFVAHRLIKKLDSSMIVTRGDNLTRHDFPVPAKNIIGRVIQIEGGGKRLKLTGLSDRLYAYIIALFSRVCFRGQVRITYILNGVYSSIKRRVII